MVCILSCVPITQSQSPVIFHHHMFDPLYPLLPPTPFPLVTTILLSGSLRFCLFLFHLLLYLTYEWDHTVLDFFFLISLSMIFSRFIRVANGGISSFFTHFLYAIYLPTDLDCFHVFAIIVNNAAINMGCRYLFEVGDFPSFGCVPRK